VWLLLLRVLAGRGVVWRASSSTRAVSGLQSGGRGGGSSELCCCAADALVQQQPAAACGSLCCYRVLRSVFVSALVMLLPSGGQVSNFLFATAVVLMALQDKWPAACLCTQPSVSSVIPLRGLGELAMCLWVLLTILVCWRG
jgi:hypothetical protein